MTAVLGVKTLARSELQLELLCWISLFIVLHFSTQGKPFLNMTCWVLAVSFRYFLGHKLLACQCEQILGNSCFDLSSCFLILQHYFKTKDYFTDVYCLVMQQWKLVLQKESLCVSPKELSCQCFQARHCQSFSNT